VVRVAVVVTVVTAGGWVTLVQGTVVVGFVGLLVVMARLVVLLLVTLFEVLLVLMLVLVLLLLLLLPLLLLVLPCDRVSATVVMLLAG